MIQRNDTAVVCNFIADHVMAIAEVCDNYANNHELPEKILAILLREVAGALDERIMLDSAQNYLEDQEANNE